MYTNCPKCGSLEVKIEKVPETEDKYILFCNHCGYMSYVQRKS